MKAGIHPKYEVVTAHCACGETFVTRSSRPELRLEICSKCHPFFTGKQKLIDSAGRVERFQKRFTKTQDMADKAAATKAAKGKGEPAAARAKSGAPTAKSEAATAKTKAATAKAKAEPAAKGAAG
jgi:large subunit ribosomal protein L31